MKWESGEGVPINSRWEIFVLGYDFGLKVTQAVRQGQGIFGRLYLIPECLNDFSNEPDTKSRFLVTWERMIWGKKESILEGCFIACHEEDTNILGSVFCM